MENRSVTPMRIAKTGYIVMSVVFCVVGVLFIALPERSAVVRLAFQYDLEFGILLIALGVISLLRTADVMDFICVAMGIAILADGLFKIQISVDARRFGIPSW